MVKYRIERLDDGKYKVTRLGGKPRLLGSLTRADVEECLRSSVSPRALASALKQLDAGEAVVEVDADLE